MAKAKKANAALWGGRFKQGPAEALMAFSRSLDTDKRMAVEDIEGSLAHVAMLAKQQLLPVGDVKKIQKGLKDLLKDAKDERFFFAAEDEDIHMYHERRLVDLVGDAGKRLHTARSRNDQVVTDARLYGKKRLGVLRELLLGLIETLVNQAEGHAEIPFMGFTHLQAAMPVSAGHWFMAYVAMLQRDLELLDHAIASTDVMPLGCGALAGTSLDIDRDFTAKTLGFSKIHQNSLDGVSDRDFMLHSIFALSMVALHLSRMAEDLVIYASHEVRLVKIEDSFATGSSMMPHKKNPDVAELMRGKAGLLMGDLQAMMTLVKGTPLAYNRDFQDDKPLFFSAMDKSEALLKVCIPFLNAIQLTPYPFAEKDPLGLSAATDLAEWLVSEGYAFRLAHEWVGSLVGRSINQNKALWELVETPSPKDLQDQAAFLTATQGKTPAARKELLNFLKNPALTIHRKSSLGGGSPASVKKQIRQVRSWLKEHRGD